ncbi:MAG: hypothetical protein COA54_05585 [Thiotrichaceae bacterium]|nr:MAG: hypothetical protein COA54_05585 [Thiotrichaceae bacterium]
MTQKIEKYLGQIINAFYELRGIAEFQLIETDYEKHAETIQLLQGYYPDGVMACVSQDEKEYLFTISEIPDSPETYYLAVMHEPERFISRWQRTDGPDEETSQWEMLEYESNFGIKSTS